MSKFQSNNRNVVKGNTKDITVEKQLKDKRVPHLELDWQDVNADNFVVKPLSKTQTGFDYCDIIYNHEGKEYKLSMNCVTTKATMFKRGQHKSYVTNLILDSNYIRDENPEVEKTLREEKSEELERFVKKYMEIFTNIMLQYIQITKPTKIKVPLEEFKKNELAVMELFEDVEIKIPIFQSNNDKYDSKAKMLMLVLNSVDPFEKDRIKRTNFRGLNEESNEENHLKIVKKVLSQSTEMTPLIKFDRVNHAKKSMGIRLVHAIVSDYFTPTGLKHQSSTYDKLSSDSRRIKIYEESKKKSDQFIESRSEFNEVPEDDEQDQNQENEKEEEEVSSTSQQKSKEENRKRFNFRGNNK